MQCVLVVRPCVELDACSNVQGKIEVYCYQHIAQNAFASKTLFRCFLNFETFFFENPKFRGSH